MALNSNKKVPIEETVGTGLPTLLAINLKLVSGNLPEKGNGMPAMLIRYPKYGSYLVKEK